MVLAELQGFKVSTEGHYEYTGFQGDKLTLRNFDQFQTVYASLEAQLEDLGVARQEIATLGVSQESIRPYAEALPRDYPLESFTRLPTKTNAAVATVSLEAMSANLVAVLIIAVASLIRQLFAWLRNRRAKDKKHTDKKEEVVKRIGTDYDKIAVVPQEQDEQTKRTLIIKRANDTLKPHLCELYNAVSMAGSAGWLKTIYDQQKMVLVDQVQRTTELLNFFEKLMKDYDPAHPEESSFAVNSGIKTVHDVLSTTSYLVWVGMKPATQILRAVAPKEFTNLKTVMFPMIQGVSGLSNQPMNYNPSIEDLMGSYQAGRLTLISQKVDNARYHSESREVEKSLKELERQQQRLKSIKVPPNMNEKIEERARGLLRSINDQISGIFMYQKLLAMMQDAETAVLRAMDKPLDELVSLKRD